jgi:hypothetical protein
LWFRLSQTLYQPFLLPYGAKSGKVKSWAKQRKGRFLSVSSAARRA